MKAPCSKRDSDNKKLPAKPSWDIRYSKALGVKTHRARKPLLAQNESFAAIETSGAQFCRNDLSSRTA
ncbi:hypothetical protein GCM10007901_39810 [Dyella acidisoli]|uniref:Uncharacterized protein n=1 Tax=Dyella acidisoli TaxID=1867834 RepID=A0ABQ5XTW2_9GAMM|nr:hypothetical protein GCM10007901_39810 [Dyella acidisoli]